MIEAVSWPLIELNFGWPQNVSWLMIEAVSWPLIELNFGWLQNVSWLMIEAVSWPLIELNFGWLQNRSCQLADDRSSQMVVDRFKFRLAAEQKLSAGRL
jgi:hypothetical protein